jgi:hypothetical protein
MALHYVRVFVVCLNAVDWPWNHQIAAAHVEFAHDLLVNLRRVEQNVISSGIVVMIDVCEVSLYVCNDGHLVLFPLAYAAHGHGAIRLDGSVEVADAVIGEQRRKEQHVNV